MKLMIVDDHAPTREFIRETIGPFAAEICECANGAEAVARCAEFKPDLVTMDLQMRPLNGLEATRQLLALHPAACVVIVTQTDVTVLRESAARAGAQHFIHKDNFAELRRYAELQMHRRAATRDLC
jgi:two-component system chemotaxis response regulator CheY